VAVARKGPVTWGFACRQSSASPHTSRDLADFPRTGATVSRRIGARSMTPLGSGGRFRWRTSAGAVERKHTCATPIGRGLAPTPRRARRQVFLK
jgi:hypothetical protein